VVRAARACTPFAFRAETLTSLIVLLAVTGIRVGEALRLDCDDIDWNQALIRVPATKFGKGRDVAVSGSTLDALAAYKDGPGPHAASDDTPGRLAGRHAGPLQHLRPHVPPGRAGKRCRSRGADVPARPRSQALLCRSDAAWLVSGRSRRRGPPAQAVHLPRASGAAFHLPVSHRHPGAARPCGRAATQVVIG
jgi:integrase